MQGFYATIHDFRKTGDFADVLYRDASFPQGFCGAAGRKQMDIQCRERACQFKQAGFIGNG